MGIVNKMTAVNSKNLYANLGYNFCHKNPQDIKTTTTSLATTIVTSNNCSEVRALMIYHQLRNAKDVLTDDFKRSDYEIQYKEKHITEALKPHHCFDKKTLDELRSFKTRFEGYLSGHKAEIAKIKEQHAEARLIAKGYGTLPEQYQHLAAQCTTDEDTIMIVTCVADLRAKLLRELQKDKAISKLMIKDLKKRLQKSTLQACMICDIIHELDARIKQLS